MSYDAVPSREYHFETTCYDTGRIENINDAENISKSEKMHPLLDYHDYNIPLNYTDIVLASQTLENIVNEGAFVETIRSTFKSSNHTHEMNNRVLKLVYDALLVQTQFLVYNNQPW